MHISGISVTGDDEMHYCVNGKSEKNADKAITNMLAKYSKHLYGLTKKEFDNIVAYDILNIVACFYAKMDEHQRALLLDSISKEFSLYNMEGIMHDLVMFADDDPYIPLSCRLVNSLNDKDLVRIIYQTLFKYGVMLTLSNWDQSNSYSNYLVLLNVAYFTALSLMLHTEDSCASSMKKYYYQDCFEDYIEHIYEKHLDDINWDEDIRMDVLEIMITNGRENDTIQNGSREEFLDAAEIMENIIKEHFVKSDDREKKKDIDFIRQKTAIRDLNISARARACLRRAGYEDIAELKDISDEELLKIKNLNMKCVREIRDIINDLYIADENDDTFEDIEILDNGQIRVDFCGLGFDFLSEKLIIKIRVHNKSCVNNYIWLKQLYINDMLYKSYMPVGTIRSKKDHYYEVTVSNVEKVNYEDIRNLTFAIEIDDENNHELANSKVVNIECDTSKESFDLVIFEEYREEHEKTNSKSETDGKTIVLVEGIDEQEFSVRTYNCLKRAGLDSLEDVCKLSPAELERVRNLGKKGFEEVLEKIKELGLSLQQDKGEEDVESQIKEGYPQTVEVLGNSLVAERDDDIKIEIVAAYWKLSVRLYVPFLKVRVTNKTNKDIKYLMLKALFYNTEGKELWDDAYDSVVSESILKPGYNRIGLLASDIGYGNKIAETSLPALTAQLYVDGKYYGNVDIPKSYSADADIELLEGIKAEKYSFTRYDEREYGLIVTNNLWEISDGIHVPSLNIDVINQTLDTKSRIFIKTVFYELENKKIWSEKSRELITSERPLLPGYKKTAFIKGDQGYSSKISDSLLPVLYAEIYINEELYGQVKINNTYENIVESTIVKNDVNISPNTEFERKSDKYFYPVIVTSYWEKSEDLFVPYLKLDITNQQDAPADNIGVKVIFTNMRDKEVWSEEFDQLIGSSDTPLKTGFMKSSFIKGSIGYKDKIDEKALPELMAEIFINGESYGETAIRQSYEFVLIDQPLKEKQKQDVEQFIKKDDRDFYPIVKAAMWENVGGETSTHTSKKTDDLYAPSIQIDVINQKEDSAKDITVKAVFYDLENRNLWSYASANLISNSDSPLKQGYRKTAFLKASVGYATQIDKSKLPSIYAEIYINNVFYGSVLVDKTYDVSCNEIPLEKNSLNFKNDFVKKNNMNFYPVVRQRCWKKNSDIYAPFILLDITNQLEVPAKDLRVKAVFYNADEQEIWSEATDTAISPDIPLRAGFNVSSFLKGNHGYEEMISAGSLPELKADIYINDTLYGSVDIMQDYHGNIVNEPLVRQAITEKNESPASNMWNAQSFLGERGYSTSKPDFQRHLILDKAVKEFGKQKVIDHISFLINMRLAQKEGATKFSNAIRKWRDDLSYIRNL